MGKRRSAGSAIQGTLGLRLRQLRDDRGWTLKDVERITRGRITASALGSYERLDRSISLIKLEELSDLYRVPMAFLLGIEEREDDRWWVSDRPPLRLNVFRLRRREELSPIAEFVTKIQLERSDLGTKLITLRGGDLRTLAHLMHLAPAQLVAQLKAEGVVVGGALKVIPGGGGKKQSTRRKVAGD